MATLEELQQQNKKLKAEIEAKRELTEIQRKRENLIKENKRLLRQAKFGKQIKFAKGVGKGLGRVSLKVGKALVKHAKKIAEADDREQRARRKVKRTTVKKRKVRKKR